MKKLGLAAITICALVAASGAGAAVNLIANGGFDADSPAPGTAPLDWDLNRPTNFVVGNEIGVVSGPNAANFGESGGIDLGQTISLVPGQAYTFSFDLAESGSNVDNKFSAAIYQGSIRHFFLNLDDPSPFGYTLFSYTFTATATSGLIEFGGGDYDGWFALDNVSVVAAPEPATWALMLAGVVGLGVAIRSRRAWSTLAQVPHGGWGGGQ